jgi:hypothetical protein
LQICIPLRKRPAKPSRSAGSSKASGTTSGISSLMGGGSTKNRSSLSRRRTRKQDPHLSFFPFPQSRSRNRGGRRAMTKSDGLQSGESYGSVNVRLHVHIISSSIRYQKSANESKKNPRMGKALMLQTSIRGHTRMSRTPGPSEGFGTKDGVYCLGCRGSMKSLLRRKLPTVLLLFQRTHL